MLKELIIASSPHETKVAILENEQLAEIYYERPELQTIAGGIYKGRVTRVLPGMQSAFVDIGLERDAFLYVSDFFEDNEEFDKVVTPIEDKAVRMEAESRIRPVNTPPAVPPVSMPVPPATAMVPPATVAGPGTGEAAGEGTAGRAEPGDDRDEHRGRRRRSRRRRFRDRGFPESKYASRSELQAPPPAPPEEESHAPEQRVPEHRVPEHRAPEQRVPEYRAPERRPAPPEDFEPIILPGESLAKYRRPQGPPPERFGPAAGETEETSVVSASGPVDEPAVAEQMREAQEGPSEMRFSVGLHAAPEIEAAAHAGAPVETEPAETAPEAAAESVVKPELVTEEEERPITHPARLGQEPPAEVAAEPETYTPQRVRAETQTEAQALAEAVLEQAEERDSAEVAAEAVDDSETDDAEGEMAEAVEAEPAVEQAEVRAPSDNPRFTQRSGRRMRRRGRDRFRADQGVETAVAPARPERTDRPDRPERSERPDRPERQERGERPDRADRPPRQQPQISDLLREGQEVLVQIAKEPLGKKGARITSHIALPGRFVVYMPTVEHVGVSRKIASDEERQRLKRILVDARRNMPGGFIVRTAGEGCSDADLRHDMEFLYKLWLDIRQRSEKKSAPAPIYSELNLIERILRDQLSEDFTAIWIDSEQEYEKVLRFVQRFQPSLVSKVKLYTKSTPIFEEFSIQEEIDKALRPKVWLKSGGYIVINQTEALVAIDINTGKYIGKTSRLEDTIVKTNVDAIQEIVRQIRLRDLGGIIVIDFIDMDERKNRSRVMQALEEALRHDRAPSKILAFNDFGLVAITRKRVKQSLERTLCAPCPVCTGSGYLKSPHTVAMEVLAEAYKLLPSQGRKEVLTLRVNPEVARYLKQRNVTVLQEIEEVARQTVIVKSDPALHPESFDFN